MDFVWYMIWSSGRDEIKKMPPSNFFLLTVQMIEHKWNRKHGYYNRIKLLSLTLKLTNGHKTDVYYYSPPSKWIAWNVQIPSESDAFFMKIDRSMWTSSITSLKVLKWTIKFELVRPKDGWEIVDGIPRFGLRSAR